MSVKHCFSIASVLGLLLLSAACSETTKQAEPLPDLITKAYFPFVRDNAIYTFDPVSGDSELLAESETGMIIALDTDLSRSDKRVNEVNVEEEFFNHTSTAEYYVYANKQTLHLYDLNTRYDHQLFSFNEDQKYDPESQSFIDAEPSYICDIQKSVILDEETRVVRTVLYKDELKVYVKTSLQEDCLDDPENFDYWQINIEESDETFQIRRRILKEHTHKHDHFHDHDDNQYQYQGDHSHDHTDEFIEAIEATGEIFDPNDHEHEHTHTHDFVYGEDHYHDFLTKEEVDAVHNDPVGNDIKTYQEVQFETHPILVGKKTTVESINEALMYTGKPVVDISKRTFGYLGLNSQTNTYHFYSVNLDSFEKRPLWSMTSDDFTNTNRPNLALSDLEKATPKFNRCTNFEYIDDHVLISSNNKLFYFTLTELFDDDENQARQAAITTPVFTSAVNTPALNERRKYNANNSRMVIVEGMDIWSIDFLTERPFTKQLIKRYNEANLNSVNAAYLGSELLVHKHFEELGTSEQALTILQQTGLEDQTLIPKTEDELSLQTLDTDILMTRYDSIDQTLSATHYGANFTSLFLDSLIDALWAEDSVDYRNYNEENVITLLHSPFLNASPFTIETPTLYFFDQQNMDNLGLGEDFGLIPQEVAKAHQVVIYDNLYGLIEVEDSNNNFSTYFFSNSKNAFNFDNQFKIMKELVVEE